MQALSKRLRTKAFEPGPEEDECFRLQIVRDFEALKAEADVIVANRATPELADVAGKVFTRDLFGAG